jgi:hypothetical protein
VYTVQVLSGFLDKMTIHSERGNDWGTMKNVNNELGRNATEAFPQTKEGFRHFLSLLARRLDSGGHVNEHFEHAGRVCYADRVRYHYRLRIEDMNMWLPCMSAALHLGHFIDTGWAHWKRTRSDWYSSHNTGCWWAPKGMSCEEYVRQGSEIVDGIRNELEAIESQAALNDVHATGAEEKWRAYYDQEMMDLVYRLYKDDFDLFGYEREVA